MFFNTKIIQKEITQNLLICLFKISFKKAQVGQKKEFLQFARDNDDIVKHESVKQIFTENWRRKAAIYYNFSLFWSVVFVVFYTIYIELEGKSDVNATFQLSAWWISLILAITNLIQEISQCILYIIYRKFDQYINRYVNK